jgi:hypothetical protein
VHHQQDGHGLAGHHPGSGQGQGAPVTRLRAQ